MPPSLTQPKAVLGFQRALLNTLFKLMLEETSYHSQQSKFKVISCADIQQQEEQVLEGFYRPGLGVASIIFAHIPRKGSCILVCREQREH